MPSVLSRKIKGLGRIVRPGRRCAPASLADAAAVYAGPSATSNVRYATGPGSVRFTEMRAVLLVAGLLTGLPLGASAQPDPSPHKPRPSAPRLETATPDAPSTSSEEAQARRDRAEAERKVREKAFDDRVRRATSSICSNCTTGPTPRRRVREQAAPEPRDPMFDPAEAPPMPD
ncbi:hypothetical protein [Methylobacterium sp. Leaf469]|uniref:hypothetical protein n=2 Tax=Methylobacterium TaxID=407 RepID=UPI001AEBFF61|nr:hypothetical protein [Methylobacterium sp. Leaf469]